MVRRFVSEWLSPFGQPRFRKPSEWAQNLRPDSEAEAEVDLPQKLQKGIERAQEALLRRQNFEDGYWCA